MEEQFLLGNRRGIKLSCLYNPSKKKIPVIMSHGFTGDKHESGLFDRIAGDLSDAGFPVIRFDFAGSGESGDDSLSVDKEVEDLSRITEFISDKGFDDYFLLGFSLGGLVSLKSAGSRVRAMMLLAPVTDKIRYSWEDRFSPWQLKEAEEKGFFLYYRTDDVIRKEYRIDRRMQEDRTNVDQAALCGNVRCPVLIYHGTEDSSVPIDNSASAVKLLPEGSRLEKIEGEGHVFSNSAALLGKAAVNWFSDFL
ncbi:MAG: alpha/beta hydrolase family protein [Fibrobacterota bacterium]